MHLLPVRASADKLSCFGMGESVPKFVKSGNLFVLSCDQTTTITTTTITTPSPSNRCSVIPVWARVATSHVINYTRLSIYNYKCSTQIGNHVAEANEANLSLAPNHPNHLSITTLIFYHSPLHHSLYHSLSTLQYSCAFHTFMMTSLAMSYHAHSDICTVHSLAPHCWST